MNDLAHFPISHTNELLCYHFPPYQTEPLDLLIYMVKHLDHTKQYIIEREDMLNTMK